MRLQQTLANLVAAYEPSPAVAVVLITTAEAVYYEFDIDETDAVRITLEAMTLGAMYNRSVGPLSDDARDYVFWRFVALLLGTTPYAGEA